MSWSSSQKKETRFAFQCNIQLTSMSAIMRLITSPTSNIPQILTHFEINTWAVRTQWFCQTQSIYPSKFFPLHWPFYLEKFNGMIKYNLDQNINLGKKRGSRNRDDLNHCIFLPSSQLLLASPWRERFLSWIGKSFDRMSIYNGVGAFNMLWDQKFRTCATKICQSCSGRKIRKKQANLLSKK